MAWFFVYEVTGTKYTRNIVKVSTCINAAPQLDDVA